MIFVLVLVPEVVLCFGILNTYESRAVSIRESEVLSQAKILANKISTSKYFDEDGGDLSNIDAQIDTLTTIYEGRVLIVDKHFKIIKDTYNLDDGNTIVSEEVIKTFSASEITNYDSKNHYIELSVPISTPKKSTTAPAIMATVTAICVRYDIFSDILSVDTLTTSAPSIFESLSFGLRSFLMRYQTLRMALEKSSWM